MFVSLCNPETPKTFQKIFRTLKIFCYLLDINPAFSLYYIEFWNLFTLVESPFLILEWLEIIRFPIESPLS